MRRPLKRIFHALLIVVVVFWPPTFLYLYYYARKSTDESNLSSGKNATFIEKHTVNLLEEGLFREACSFLKNSYDNRIIATYGIETESVQCHQPQDLDISKYKIIHGGKIHSIETSAGMVAYKVHQIGDAKFLLSQVIGGDNSYMSLLSKNPRTLIMGLLVDTAIAVWIVLVMWIVFVLRNIENMRLLYRKTHRVPLWHKAIDKLAKLFEGGDEASIKSMQNISAVEIDNLRKELLYYTDTLEYALIEELKERGSTSFPISFRGTVARIDINGYGAFNYEGNDSYLSIVKKSFAWLSAECAHRYGGLFEERVGDMVVYIFLGDCSEQRAASFVRDFSHEFSSLKFSFLHHKDISFKVKSSIISSQLEMDVAPSKYDYSGSALYRSDRVLGDIAAKEKSSNVLVILPDSYPALSSIAKEPYMAATESKKEVSINVAYINSFYSFRDNPSLGHLHLGEDGLRQQLDYLVDKEIPTTDRLAVADRLLKSLRTKRVSESLSSAWLNTVINLSGDGDSTQPLLSTTISLGRNLVPYNNWRPDYSSTILSVAEKMDGRSIANTIELFAMWNDFDSAKTIFEKACDIPDSYRLRGNYLLTQGLYELSEHLFDELISMIKSSNPRLRDSGIYAGSMLIILKKEKDYTELATYDGYYKLLGVLRDLPPLSDQLNGFIAKALHEG